MKIIDGEKLAEKAKDEIVAKLTSTDKSVLNNGRRPSLAIILVGEREDSQLYVSLKEKEAKKVGVDTHLYKFEQEVDEKEIKETIKFLNNDQEIDAVLLQLPLPKKFNTDEIIKLIDPKKDVDCLHPDNLKTLSGACSHDILVPPLFQVVFKILESANYETGNKRVCIVANSPIFRKTLAKVFACRGAETEETGPDDKDLQDKTSQADILITAVGRKHFLKKEHIKKNALIIDIGIKREEGKVFGDVDFDDVKEKAGFITPVPGGVGPMTVAMALFNTVELYKRNKERKT